MGQDGTGRGESQKILKIDLVITSNKPTPSICLQSVNESHLLLELVASVESRLQLDDG